MEMVPVQSSMLSHIGFDPTTNEFLAQYNTGTLGAYGPATREEFEQVLGSPSVGVAFNKIIKPTKKYRKVEADAPAQQASTEPIPAATVVTQEVAAPVEEEQVIQQTTDIATQAHSLAILDADSHVKAQGLVVDIANMRSTVTAFFKPMKDAAHKAHKAICDKENETLKPLLAAAETLGKSIVRYEDSMEEQRLAYQEKLRIEQAAKTEAEAKQESERLAIDDAIVLEEQGDIAGAEAVLANPVPVTPVYTPPVIVPTTVSRVSGVVKKVTWMARVTNPALVPREWLIVNESALNKHAANLKHMAVVPGVEFYPDTAVHGRKQ